MRFQQSWRLKKGSVPVRHSSAALGEKRGKIWREVGNGKYQGMKKMDHLFSAVFFCLAVKGSCTISLAQPTSQPVLPWLFPSRSLSFSPSHPFLSSATNVGKCKRGNSSVEWFGRRHLLFLLSASPPSPLVWKFSDDASATSPTAGWRCFGPKLAVGLGNYLTKRVSGNPCIKIEGEF